MRKYKERCLKLENSKVVLEEKLNSSQLKNNKVELELNEFQNTREELQLLQNVKFSVSKQRAVKHAVFFLSSIFLHFSLMAKVLINILKPLYVYFILNKLYFTTKLFYFLVLFLSFLLNLSYVDFLNTYFLAETF